MSGNSDEGSLGEGVVLHRRPQHTKATGESTMRQRQSTAPRDDDRSRHDNRKQKPSSASATKEVGGESHDGFLTRLRSLMFSKEDFSDFNTANSVRQVSAVQEQLVRYLDKLRLPEWVKHALFDSFDFLTRRRVYVVVIIVAIVFFLAVRMDTFNDITGSIFAYDNRPGTTFLNKFNGGRRTLPNQHPVVIVPGFITTALELWESNLTCVRDQFLISTFRQRMFGPQMIYLILRDPLCWLQLFAMDKHTGLDKRDIKVRASSGFTSVDYFVPGFWVWAKVLTNLADIGYDPLTMTVLAYDWRMTPWKTHERDAFFYEAHSRIQFYCQKTRSRAVVISHSYGTTVALSFFKWAEQRNPGFMNKYVAYYINIGGTTMGIPKAASAMLLGDVRDTMSIPHAARRMLDTFISQSARFNLTRTWSCLAAMLPHSCADAQPDILVDANGSSMDMYATMKVIKEECQRTNHTDCVKQVSNYMESVDEMPVLPQAPDTTVLCLYGVNKLAEVGYRLQDGYPFSTNMSYFDNDTTQGVRLGNGDGTVPLMSLGYMCRAPNGWVKNVGRVVTVEHRHDPDKVNFFNIRGNGDSGDHVDILGNYEMIEVILKAVSGVDEVGADDDEVTYHDPETNQRRTLHRRVKDRLYSDIDERIRTQAAQCTRKENKPITFQKPRKDDNEFL